MDDVMEMRVHEEARRGRHCIWGEEEWRGGGGNGAVEERGCGNEGEVEVGKQRNGMNGKGCGERNGTREGAGK